MEITRSDWNLLVLAAADGQPLTPAQFQKVIFLLQQRCPNAIPGGYSFRPYNYGPFDADVYSDAETLKQRGLARIERFSGGLRMYAASELGLRRAKEIAERADPRAVVFAKRAVEWARGLSFSELVKSIYQEFPEMKANSIFKDEK
jgi:uncharacterized protein